MSHWLLPTLLLRTLEYCFSRFSFYKQQPSERFYHNLSNDVEHTVPFYDDLWEKCIVICGRNAKCYSKSLLLLRIWYVLILWPL